MGNVFNLSPSIALKAEFVLTMLIVVKTLSSCLLYLQRTLEKLRDRLAEKKAEIAVMVEKTSEIKRRKDELNHHISLVW